MIPFLIFETVSTPLKKKQATPKCSTLKKALPNNIRRWRDILGIPQEELSDRCGCHIMTIQRVEGMSFGAKGVLLAR